ncbi:hypothetical protein ACFV0O_32465 [Kitasatospora sp. NPDC059577]|uniref:hypothetical protein n=1 Tax=Kitasatospora sp. NPDC059577 TaxID=3346873 RepID=UPI0036B234EE
MTAAASSGAGRDGRDGGARIDPLLADRVTEALLLAGLPVAHGGHGPGVRLGSARPSDDSGDSGESDDFAGLLVLHWKPGPRLVAAAAMEGPEDPVASARRVVTASMGNALAELLPGFGIEVVPGSAGGEVRVVRVSGPAPAVGSGGLAAATVGARPQESGVGADVVAAVRRAAALAGLPVADHLSAPGITLGPCPPVDDGDDTTGLADLGWNPSRRLSTAAADDGPAAEQAARACTAVRDAMRHAIGSVLGACGLDARWRRPTGIPYQLRAHGPAEQPPIRH